MRRNVLSVLGLEHPVVAAPMAGGPTTPELVLAAAGTGALGFLAAGYKTPELLVEQISAVRAASDVFGVNLFAPNPVPVDLHRYRRYREAVRPDAERLGAAVPEDPLEDDDHWRDKVDVLIANPVAVVSFTFGIPDRAVLDALRRAGSLLVQTVTSADEARRAADARVDVLAVQASAAGGHSGTLTPGRIPAAIPLAELLGAVGRATTLPLIAAGGLAGPSAVAQALRDGAQAVAVGTALLLAPEAGTNPAHRAGLSAAGADTVVTRAFTGRPARAVPNRFTAAHDAEAPPGYPALHHLTAPLRRAAAAAGDQEYVNLWAGTGYRAIREQPAATTLATLAGSI